MMTTTTTTTTTTKIIIQPFLQTSNAMHLVANSDPDVGFSGRVHSNLEIRILFR